MITPNFKLTQNDDFLFIEIKAPYAKLSELDIFIDENDFRFYCKPYFLRLHLPGSILENNENDDVVYDFEESSFKLKFEKKNSGEPFEGLDFITKLLTPARKKTPPLIEEITKNEDTNENVNQLEKEETNENIEGDENLNQEEENKEQNNQENDLNEEANLDEINNEVDEEEVSSEEQTYSKEEDDEEEETNEVYQNGYYHDEEQEKSEENKENILLNSNETQDENSAQNDIEYDTNSNKEDESKQEIEQEDYGDYCYCTNLDDDETNQKSDQLESVENQEESNEDDNQEICYQTDFYSSSNQEVEKEEEENDEQINLQNENPQLMKDEENDEEFEDNENNRENTDEKEKSNELEADEEDNKTVENDENNEETELREDSEVEEQEDEITYKDQVKIENLNEDEEDEDTHTNDEIEDYQNEDEMIDEEDGSEWFIEQTINNHDDLNLNLNPCKYGFAQTKSNVFSRLSEEYQLVIDLPDPDNNREDRTKQRIDDEGQKFNDDHYLADYFDDSEMIESTILKYTPLYENDYTDAEIDILKNLPKRTYLLDKEEKFYAFSGLIDILFAYCYNKRINCGEKNVESGWNIAKLSSTLSWFDTFKSLQDVLVASYRRSLCFPLYRNWKITQMVYNDIVELLKHGQKQIIKSLLDIRKSFLDKCDNRYILNDLYINDYIVWIQYVNSKKLNSLIESIQSVKITKQMVDFDLECLEICGQLALDSANRNESDNESEYSYNPRYNSAPSSVASDQEDYDEIDDNLDLDFDLNTLRLEVKENNNTTQNKPKIVELN